jgi:hypothetical protein
MRSDLHKLWYDYESTGWRCREYHEECVRSLPTFESICELTSPKGPVYPRLLRLFEEAVQVGILGRDVILEIMEPMLRSIAVAELDDGSYFWDLSIEAMMEGSTTQESFHKHGYELRNKLSSKDRQVIHERYAEISAQMPVVDWAWVQAMYQSIKPRYTFNEAGLARIADDLGVDADLSISDEQSWVYLPRLLHDFKGRYLNLFTTERQDAGRYLSLVKATADSVKYPLQENLDCQQIFRWGISCLYNEIALNLIWQMRSGSSDDIAQRVTQALIEVPTPIAAILLTACLYKDPMIQRRCTYILGERQQHEPIGFNALVYIMFRWWCKTIEIDLPCLREVILALGKYGRPLGLHYITLALAERRIDPSLEAVCSEALDNIAARLGLESYDIEGLQRYIATNRRALVRRKHEFLLISQAEKPDRVLFTRCDGVYERAQYEVEGWLSSWDSQSKQRKLEWDGHIWDRYNDFIKLGWER